MARTPGSHTQRHSAKPIKNARQRAWNAMRVLKVFDALGLEISAAISQANLEKYLKALYRAGYLHQDRPKQNGKSGGYVIWRLVGYTGPLAPIVRSDRSGVYDPNRAQFVPFRNPETPPRPTPPKEAVNGCLSPTVSLTTEESVDDHSQLQRKLA